MRRLNNIAIVTASKPGYSDTFVKAHLKLLPANVHHFYGLTARGFPPIYIGKDEVLFSDNVLVNYIETAVDRITGESGLGFYFRTKRMKKYLQENKIQAVLAEFGPVGTFVMEACEASNVPLLVYFYGRDAYHFDTLRRFEKRYKKMFEVARKVLVVSKPMGEQLVRLGLKSDKIIYNPCPPQAYFNNATLRSKPPLFLAVGRFTAKKSPESTIRAFAKVTKVVQNARLIMVGDGTLLNSCSRLSIKLNIMDKVDFAGPKTPEELAAIYQKSRVFVQHSVVAEDGDSEGTPVAILEAMASGLPVVSTRHAGIQDVVVEGQTGYLVKEHDIEGMAKQMIVLALDDELAYNMGQKGATRVEECYTMDQHIDDLWSTIREQMLNL